MQSFWSLSAEQKQILEKISPKLASGVYHERPNTFDVESATKATVTVNKIEIEEDEQMCKFSGTIEFEFLQGKRIVVGVVGVCGHGRIAYMFPTAFKNVERLKDLMDSDMTLIMYPNEFETDIFVSKGVRFVGSFFKTLSAYEESVANSFESFKELLKELDILLKNLPEEKRMQFEEELYEAASGVQNAFNQLASIITKAAQVYTKITNAE